MIKLRPDCRLLTLYCSDSDSLLKLTEVTVDCCAIREKLTTCSIKGGVRERERERGRG